MGFGLAFAGASFVYGVVSGKEREKDTKAAQDEKRATQDAIRKEQAVRERKKQARTGSVLAAQSQAIQLAQGSGASSDTNISGALASVDADVARNLSAINFSLSSGAATGRAQQDIFNAARPATSQIVNQQLQPAIFSNIDKLDEFFKSSFGSDSGTGT